MKTIGVFDSGVGGLSVLRALLAEMPQARYVYLADGAHAPYGERSQQQVAERAHRITDGLRNHFGIDALVVACNTATALAIEGLRAQHPEWPIVGVEPALKPAAAITRTGHVGVMATRGTVESERFARLRQRLEQASENPLHFSCQACDGLADAIERNDRLAIESLCQRYWSALQSEHTSSPIDTLVLGCTHYPFAADMLQKLAGDAVTLVETGIPVARRTRAVLDLPPPNGTESPAPTGVVLLSTGDPAPLSQAAQRWLGLASPGQNFAC
ncbi:glutamate racemase [Hydrogenophaga sp. RWCD_12]|uniref:glutamate racemase n=1 Tax=Hydrogenophaga sp. RWCD_12 TaxID=3391190 RepID=UPI00398538F4